MDDLTPDTKQCPMGSKQHCHWTQGLMWWTTLLVAVLAVPIIGVTVALGNASNPFVQMLLFIVTCWACTWLGMWLMKKANHNNLHH